MIILLYLIVIIKGNVHSFGGLLLGDGGLGSTHEGAGLGRGKSTHCNINLCNTALNCIQWNRRDGLVFQIDRLILKDNIGFALLFPLQVVVDRSWSRSGSFMPLALQSHRQIV